MAIVILGVVVAVCIWIIQTRRFGWVAKTVTLVVAGLGIAVFLLVARPESFLGSAAWYERTPYKEICFLLLMLLGMVVRYFAYAIEQRRDRLAQMRKEGQANPQLGLQFDAWEFSYPLLFSVVTFGGLLGQVKDGGFTVANAMLSFQSGFFWQTLLKKSAPAE
jgi:hypothetical protein